MKRLLFLAALVLCVGGCAGAEPDVNADVKKVNVNLTYQDGQGGAMCFQDEQTFIEVCDAWVCQPVDSTTVYPAQGW